jgi:hypothetical protein
VKGSLGGEALVHAAAARLEARGQMLAELAKNSSCSRESSFHEPASMRLSSAYCAAEQLCRALPS